MMWTFALTDPEKVGFNTLNKYNVYTFKRLHQKVHLKRINVL